MFNKNNRSKKGFTLIELLVVVAIISLLSSIVLASLKSAREKAKDTALKAELRQLENLAALNYNEYGSFSNLQPGGTWINAVGDNVGPMNTAECERFVGGIYAAQVRAICANIVSLTTGVQRFGANNNVSLSQAYSFVVYLPYAQQYFCIGSSGRNSIVANGAWGLPGCFNSP